MLKTKILLLVIFLVYVTIILKRERFSSLVYDKSVILAENGTLQGNMDVRGELNTNQVCGDKFCNNGEKLAFMNDRLPNLTDEQMCISDVCLERSHIQLLKRNNVIREKLKLKVVSSGLVSGVVWGIADFYINDKRVRTPTHRGLNIVTADPRGIFVRHRSFDTHGQNAAAAAAIQYINSIPQGHYVMVACADECSNFLQSSVHLYEHGNRTGWYKRYRLNADGSDTYIPSDWLDRNSPLRFPNDSLSSLRVDTGLLVEIYEHGYGHGHRQVVGPGTHTVSRNDAASSIIIKKQSRNAMLSPMEALINCGGNGVVVPNYRGSYLLIGRKGMERGTATEMKRDSNSASTNRRRIEATREFDTNIIYVDIPSN